MKTHLLNPRRKKKRTTRRKKKRTTRRKAKRRNPAKRPAKRAVRGRARVRGATLRRVRVPSRRTRRNPSMRRRAGTLLESFAAAVGGFYATKATSLLLHRGWTEKTPESIREIVRDAAVVSTAVGLFLGASALKIVPRRASDSFLVGGLVFAVERGVKDRARKMLTPPTGEQSSFAWDLLTDYMTPEGETFPPADHALEDYLTDESLSDYLTTDEGLGDFLTAESL